MTDSSDFTLIIQSNSPGELSNWVIPFAKKFKEKNPRSTLFLYLTPCQYATGSEVDVAKKINIFQEIFTPKETIKTLLSLPLKIKSPANGAVLCLGGDPQYSKLLGFKFSLPVYLYTEHNIKKSWGIKKVFRKSEVGDLMYEKLKQFQINKPEILKKYNLAANKYCLFFCGSRPQHFLALYPFIIETISLIKKADPDFKAIINISPYINDKIFNSIFKEEHKKIVTIIQGDSLEVMAISGLLVTLPGSSTADAMYMGLPMIVIMPLNKPELIILDGLAGLIGAIPGIGFVIKKIIIWILSKQKRFYALPNKITNKKIVTEIVEILEQNYLAKIILDKFNDPNSLKNEKKELQKLIPSQNTIDIIVEGLKK